MLYICDLPKNLLETATKENLQTYQKKSKYGRKCVDKVISVVQLLVQLDGQTYCCC